MRKGGGGQKTEEGLNNTCCLIGIEYFVLVYNLASIFFRVDDYYYFFSIRSEVLGRSLPILVLRAQLICM